MNRRQIVNYHEYQKKRNKEYSKLYRERKKTKTLLLLREKNSNENIKHGTDLNESQTGSETGSECETRNLERSSAELDPRDLLSVDELESDESDEIEINDVRIEDLEIEIEDDYFESTSAKPKKSMNFMVALYCFKMKHSLSDQAIQDLVQLLKLYSPENENHTITSLPIFEKKLLSDSKASYFDCCDKCQFISSRLKLDTFVQTKKKCPKCINKELVQFLCFDPKAQLIDIIKKNDNLEQIKASKRTAVNFENSSEIIDSPLKASIYQDYIKSQSNSHLTISLNLNTDGAPLLESKNFSMWPNLGTILELDQNVRESFQNLIVFGKRDILFFILILINLMIIKLKKIFQKDYG